MGLDPKLRTSIDWPVTDTITDNRNNTSTLIYLHYTNTSIICLHRHLQSKSKVLKVKIVRFLHEFELLKHIDPTSFVGQKAHQIPVWPEDRVFSTEYNKHIEILQPNLRIRL